MRSVHHIRLLLSNASSVNGSAKRTRRCRGLVSHGGPVDVSSTTHASALPSRAPRRGAGSRQRARRHGGRARRAAGGYAVRRDARLFDRGQDRRRHLRRGVPHPPHAAAQRRVRAQAQQAGARRRLRGADAVGCARGCAAVSAAPRQHRAPRESAREPRRRVAQPGARPPGRLASARRDPPRSPVRPTPPALRRP